MANTKPPIGLTPERFWKRERKCEIVLAITRYIKAELPIPTEWVDEYNRLTKEENK